MKLYSGVEQISGNAQDEDTSKISAPGHDCSNKEALCVMCSILDKSGVD
jgi:hypothetical protein